MHVNKKAFTLIELLVVVLIIGILAAIALPQYLKAVEKSRASEALINIRAIERAQELHVLATGSGAADFDELDISIPGADKTSPTKIETKYFVYQISSGDGVHVYRKSSPYAFRIPGTYANGKINDRRIICAWSDDKYEAICRSFGSVSDLSDAIGWFGFTGPTAGAVWL
jgi:prepilin-type N-terminal cleavage/methylation domain-containing protein